MKLLRRKSPGKPEMISQKSTSKIGFKEDDSSPGNFYFMDFTKFSEHVAWRVAHFIDDGRLDRDQSFDSFKAYMSKSGININVVEMPVYEGNTLDLNKKTKCLLFSDAAGLGFAMADFQICDELKFDKLKDYFDLDNQRVENVVLQRLKLVPERNSPLEPSWAFMNTGKDREGLDHVLKSAFSDAGVYGVFKPKGLGEGDDAYSRISAKMISREKRNGSFTDVPYSKTFRPIKGHENTYSLETNSNASVMKFETVGAKSLEDFVDNIYKSGSFTIHGKPVFADRSFYGRRTKNAKIAKYKATGEPGYLSFIPQDIKSAFASHIELKYGRDKDKYSDLLKTAALTSFELGNILPQQRKVFGIDVDNLKITDEIDFIKNKNESIAWLRERMPEALQSAKMVIMLSSSYGMIKDNGVATFRGKTQTVSLRLWIESDKHMDVEEFKSLLRHHYDDLSADTALFTHNQPIYGPPKFEMCEDPIKDHRFIVVPGEEAFDLDMLREEVAELDQQKGIHTSHHSFTSSGTAPVVRVAVNPMDGPIEQSRDRTLAKLAALGDREEMHLTSGARDHFGAVRQIINAHLNAVYDLYPASRPMTQADVFNDERIDPLSEEVRFLNHAIRDAFIEAVGNPDKETDMSYLSKYGIGPDGLILNSNFSKLLEDSCQHIANAREQKYKQCVSEIIQYAKDSKPLSQTLISEYLSKYTIPTSINKSLHTLRADVFTDHKVLVNPEGIYFDNSSIPENDRIVTYTGEKRFFFAPVYSDNNIPKSSLDWKASDMNSIYRRLEEVDRIQDLVFCRGCDLEDIRDLLPVRKNAALKLNISRFIKKTVITRDNPVEEPKLKLNLKPTVKTSKSPSL